MKTRDEIFKETRERLKNVIPMKPTLIPDNGETLKPHQIWSVKKGYLFYINEVLDDDMVNINVLFHWSELAGPSDLKLPIKFMASRAVLSFELEATVLTKELDECIGRFDEEAIELINIAREELELPLSERKLYWGRTYLDKIDHIYKYHSKIVKELEGMQSKLEEMIK